LGGQGDDVVVVFNFSNKAFHDYRVGFPQAGNWHLRANTDADVYDCDFGETPAFDTVAEDYNYDGFDHSGIVSIPPYTALVFSQ
jgi:1,4-alpha-glucan branching enzyme